jgi:hypothetical protein
MKRISILSTFIFLLIVAVPSFANDSYQNNRAHEQAKRRVRQHNAKLQQEYEKAMREYEAKVRAYKGKNDQRDVNSQREYEKAMREYNVKVRANQSLLRRVERQYPGIRLDAADAVKANSSEIVSEDQSSVNENSPTNGQSRGNRSPVKHYKSPRRNIRSKSVVNRHDSTGQRAYGKQRRVRVDQQGRREIRRHNANLRNERVDQQRRREVRRHNANLRNEYEKKKREYDKAVKEAKRQQREVAKHNERVRKHNEQVRQYNAAQAAQRNAQGSVGRTYRRRASRPNYQPDTGHDSNRKPYRKQDSNSPRYMRDD